MKLQLRLDQEQTDALIGALTVAVSAVVSDEALHRYAQLRSWLIWRRDKLWGQPAGGQAAPAQDPPIPLFCAICSTRVDNGTGKCQNGHYLPPVTPIPFQT